MPPCNDLHGRVISFKELGKTIPTRKKFLNKTIYKKVSNDLTNGKPLLFMPTSLWDTRPLQEAQYQKAKYVLTLFGILEDGRKMALKINNIEVYFEIKIPSKIKQDNISNFAENLFIELSMNGEQDLEKFNKRVGCNRKSEYGFKIEPIKYEVVTGKPLHLFQEHESYYARIYFDKLSHRKNAIEYIRALGYDTAHDDLNNYFRVASRDYLIPLANWLILSDYEFTTYDTYIKEDVLSISVNNIKQYSGPEEEHLVKDFTMTMAFDIETFNKKFREESEKTIIPMPGIAHHSMFMISMCFQWHTAKDQLLNVCLVDVPGAPHPDFLTIVCETEENLIRGFGQVCEKMRPDLIMGFNSDNYDWTWIIERGLKYDGVIAELNNCLNMTIKENLDDKDAMRDYVKSEIKIENGNNHPSTNLQVPGCIPFDVMIIFRQLYPTSEKYGLNFFLKENNLESKEDMLYREMFEIYDETKRLFDNKQKIPDELLEKVALIGKYCVVDSIRCHDLTKKRNVLQDKREIAILSYTSLHDAFYKANGMKVCNLVITEGNKRNLKISNINGTTKDSRKYPGAWVFPPKKGLYASKLSIDERIEKAKNGYKEHEPWLNESEESIEKYIEFISEHGATPDKEIVSKTDFPKHVKDMLIEPIGRPISGLDFSSLYPSLMMCYNLSPEYIIKDIKYAKEVNALKNPDGSKKHELHKIKFNYGDETIRAWSVRHDNKLDPTQPDFKFGLFPYILQRLFNDRKKLKKGSKEKKGLEHWGKILDAMKKLPAAELAKPEVMEEFENATFEYNALDSKQKALKVYMNTFYGCAGNQISPLFMLPVAGGITSAGQANIRKAYDHVVGKDCKVYYGDSVTPDTPILIRYTKGPLAGNIDIRTIDDIPGLEEFEEDNKWVEYPQFKPAETEPIRINKEQHLPYDGLETWTSLGWKKIKRIIRHKTQKKIIRINTHSGCVDVTEDHSLLTADRVALSPKDAKVGDELFHGFPEEFHSEPKFIENDIYYSERIPISILNASLEIRKNYFDIYYYPNGEKNKYYQKDDHNIFLRRMEFHIKGKLHAQCLYYLLRSIGYDNIDVRVLESRPSMYRVSICHKEIRNQIRKKFSVNINSENQYIEVYDIETEAGDFQAGVGELVLWNTDSLYISMPEQSYEEIDKLYYTRKLGKREYWEKMVDITFEVIKPINEEVNLMFKKDNGTDFLRMAYEESLFPCALLGKKKYYGIPHEFGPNFNPDIKDKNDPSKNDKFKLFIRGLDLKKRGVSELLVKICKDILLQSVDYENLLTLMEISTNAIDNFYKKDWSAPENIEAFTMTGIYKPNKQNVKMHTLKRRMLEERGIEIPAGERIKFIVTKKYPFKYDIRGRSTKISIGDQLELLETVLAENIPIDIDYYMDSSIAGQLARLICYHPDFQVPIADDTDLEQIKKAEDENIKLAKKFIKDYCKKFFQTHKDHGKVYKAIFNGSSKIVKERIIYGCGNNKANQDIVKLLGFSVDYEGELGEWLIDRVVKDVQQRKSNKKFGELYVENLLQPARLKSLGKTRTEYIHSLRTAYYSVLSKKNGGSDTINILTSSEKIYKERQQVLELRLRKSINAIRAVYQANNHIIEKVVTHIKKKLNISYIEEIEDPKNDIGSLISIDEEALAQIADEQISLKIEQMLKDMAELKYIYYNLIGNYTYIYRVRSIVDYLKTLRNKAIGNIKPLKKDTADAFIKRMISETLAEPLPKSLDWS